MEEIITVESEYEQLKRKMKILRTEVSTLTAQRDELLLRECPRIKAEYDARIGQIELRVFSAQNRLYELKRAIEILQAARNRREQKSSDEAAEQAHKEYEAYEEDLKRKAEDIKSSSTYQEREEEQERKWQTEHNRTAEDTSSENADAAGNAETAGNTETADSAEATDSTEESDSAEAADSTKSTGSTETSANPEQTGETEKQFKSRAEELRYYYRLLVKRLHPDTHPNQTAEEAELLQQTMKAYKNGDLDRLKEIFQTLKDRRSEEKFTDKPEDIAEMKKIIARLEKKKAALQEEIKRIMQDYPYKWKTLLENDEEVAALQKNLANQLNEYEKQYQELLVRFEKLKNGEEPA
jgi:hypothetical protein